MFIISFLLFLSQINNSNIIFLFLSLSLKQLIILSSKFVKKNKCILLGDRNCSVGERISRNCWIQNDRKNAFIRFTIHLVLNQHSHFSIIVPTLFIISHTHYFSLKYQFIQSLILYFNSF